MELIPNDPNPYDSYAELLLKMGRFDESIAQYRKALSIDPNFIASHLGSAADLMYLGKPDDAAAELQKISEKARNDGERRTALFGMTVLAIDRGQWEKALEEVDKQYALGEKTNDVPAMVGDLQLKGNILVEMGKYDQAKESFDRALKVSEASSLSQEIKDNAKLTHHFNLATVALGKKELAQAKAEAEEFRKGAEASKNPAQVRLAHELAGMIGLAEKDYDKAIAELKQANQQNSLQPLSIVSCLRGQRRKTTASEELHKAAHFNPLPAVNHAFVRTKAEKMASTVKT